MKWLLLAFLFINLFFKSIAQKPVVDSSTTLVAGRWPYVAFPMISNNGNYVLYLTMNVPAGSNTLVIKSTSTVWKREFSYLESNNYALAADGKIVVFKVSGDSVCLFTLRTGEETWLLHVNSFKLSGEGANQWVAVQRKVPENELTVRNLTSGDERQFNNVIDYTFNKTGTALVVRKNDGIDNNKTQILRWENLITGKEKNIWQGKKVYSYSFDDSGRQLVFIAEEEKKESESKSVWYFKSGMEWAKLKVDEKTALGIDSNLIIDEFAPLFSHDGNQLFFGLKEKPLPKPMSDAARVDLWNYKDLTLQSFQLEEVLRPKVLLAAVGTADNHVIQLQENQENIIVGRGKNDGLAVVCTRKGNWTDSWWTDAIYSTMYLESLRDGSRKLIKSHMAYPMRPDRVTFSPGGQWLVYYDRAERAWFSYSISKGISLNITQNIPTKIFDENDYEYSKAQSKADAVGIGGWLIQDKSLLLYDNYDIWKVDPEGIERPINITNGYGRRHHIKFRLALDNNKEDNIISARDTLLLSAFNTQTKLNGFYSKILSLPGDPELLTMGPHILYAIPSQLFSHSLATATVLLKARDAHTWVLSSRNATSAPNFYITHDFKTFSQISDCQPQKSYNWLTTELVHWKMQDGKASAGILYKPENFNPRNKYPLIIYYYEKHSDELNDYPIPSLSYGPINIPYFVSRGYLIFVPDIYYKIGMPGESCVNAVVSAAHYLSQLPYIDAKHMGIQGHSFGGFETNYLVTHTHLFAAAAEAAGKADYINDYGSLMYGYGGAGSSSQFFNEIGQGRIGATLWERQDLYIKNSPILRANHVTTPLLMMHNKRDGSVPFSQAIEFFTDLRRLRKRVWLLQYDEGTHTISEKRDARDYTIRLCQFFDHYLKEKPAPEWMTVGIPARLKGLKTGYELDKSHHEP
ncbi:MAG TPA: prolyl oligopeptidase family serine peptidase [Puia sp.]|jgi:dienelactone hydrolase